MTSAGVPSLFIFLDSSLLFFYLSGYSEMKERELGEVLKDWWYSDLGEMALETRFPSAEGCLVGSLLVFMELMISLLCLTSYRNLLLNFSLSDSF